MAISHWVVTALLTRVAWNTTLEASTPEVLKKSRSYLEACMARDESSAKGGLGLPNFFSTIFTAANYEPPQLA